MMIQHRKYKFYKRDQHEVLWKFGREKLFLVRYFIKDMNRMCEFGLEFGRSEMLGKGISGGNNSEERMGACIGHHHR